MMSSGKNRQRVEWLVSLSRGPDEREKLDIYSPSVYLGVFT
jgi:hypothetical protein